MKVKCIHDNWNEIFGNKYSISNIPHSGSNFYINIGEEYTVYGITVRDGYVWYYICDRVFTYFPRWKPSLFFRVIDPRLSRYWIYSFEKLEDYVQAYPIITFPEWAINHPDFYDKLSDGEKQEVQIFKSYKELMDLEFPDSSISETAQIGDNEWLICPECLDAWQYGSEKDALVRCPKCLKIFNNPRYKDERPHL